MNSSGEKPVWPDETEQNYIPSGEMLVWPDGKRLNDVSSTERRVRPDKTAQSSQPKSGKLNLSSFLFCTIFVVEGKSIKRGYD